MFLALPDETYEFHMQKPFNPFGMIGVELFEIRTTEPWIWGNCHYRVHRDLKTFAPVWHIWNDLKILISKNIFQKNI